MNLERVEAFRGSGGVRLEDDVFVRADGVENLSLCPRTVEEFRSVKKRWKLAARLRRVSGAAAGVVRAEPHGARGTDEARPPARRVSDPL